MIPSKELQQLKERFSLTPEEISFINDSEAGITIENQAVFLRGINDSVGVLKALCGGMVEVGVVPRYLLQADLAVGTSHFRVPLRRGLQIIRELRKELSALTMPAYVINLPYAGGRIPITEPIEETGGWFHLMDMEGRYFSYPQEEE